MLKRLGLAIVFSVALIAVSGVAHAAPLNVATVRAKVLSAVSDCPSCSPLAPHGCYVVVAAPDQLVIGAPSVSESCATFAAGSCFEVTGEVTNDAVAEGFPFDRIQLAGHLWTLLPSSYCDYE